MQKENITDGSDFSENEIPDLNYLKPFEFEPKKIIEDTNFSGSDDEEEGMEDKVKRIGNSKCCKCSKQCKPMKTSLKVYAAENEMIYLNVTSKVSVSG